MEQECYNQRPITEYANYLAWKLGYLQGKNSPQSVLQTWLRNKHKLHIHLCFFHEDERWNADVYTLPESGLLNMPMSLKGQTYEDALDRALTFAVKYLYAKADYVSEL